MTESTPAPLDPDEVTCPKCGAQAAEICRQPNGDPARTVHLLRRRLAAGETAPPAKTPQPPTRKGGKPKGSSTFDSASASEAARKSAQTRRRRAAEAAAATEAKVVAAEAAAIDEQATKLAEDAVRFAKDRAIVKRQTLDATQLATTRLVEALTHLRRPRSFDQLGKPAVEKLEAFHTVKGVRLPLFDADGDRVIDERPDLVGYYSVDQIAALAKAHAAILVSLRLEEGKATEISGSDGLDVASVLGDAGVGDLVKWAEQNLPPGAK